MGIFGGIYWLLLIAGLAVAGYAANGWPGIAVVAFLAFAVWAMRRSVRDDVQKQQWLDAADWMQDRE